MDLRSPCRACGRVLCVGVCYDLVGVFMYAVHTYERVVYGTRMWTVPLSVDLLWLSGLIYFDKLTP